MPNLNSFLEYIGPADSLHGYTLSYKIVLLIYMFELVDDEGKVEQDELYKGIQQFYVNRNSNNLKADVDGSVIQKEINNLTLNTVRRVMNANAFRVIRDKGFIDVKKVDGLDYIYFEQELWGEVRLENIDSIKELLNQKLELYYKIRIEAEGMETLNHYISYIMDRYLDARMGEEFTNHELGKLLRQEIPAFIEKLSIMDSGRYSAKGTIGAGVWTKTPWIAILDNKIGATMQEGVYIVYVFSSDMERVYLTLNQGVTNYRNNYGKRRTIEYLKNEARKIRKYFDPQRVILNNDIVLDGTENADLYEKGTIAYIEYTKGQIPEEERLLHDLEYFISAYKDYANSILLSKADEQKDVSKIKESENDIMNYRDIINHITKYILSKGFKYDKYEITNFYLCLKSKPFVLLAGISGTGKSKLVQLFAEAIGATSQNGRYNIIPVRPDWSDPSDLLGYRNIEGNFQPGPLTTIIKNAMDNPELPYFVCLDEMNLARVEYYFSDILSIIETRDIEEEGVVTDRLFRYETFGDDEESRERYGHLYLPDNLYIVGTVNMDETTFPFSKKVLDRANTIEFNRVDLAVNFDDFIGQDSQIESLNMPNKEIRSKYVKLLDCIDEREHIEKVIYILEKINTSLEKVGLQFGYRIRDEIIFYTLYAIKENLMAFDTAMDYSIKQKILPRIQGNNLSIKEVLIELFLLFINDVSRLYDALDNEVSIKMDEYIKENTVRYPLCSDKICKMIGRYEQDGFTTFWE